MKIFISILRFEPGRTLGGEVYLRSLLDALSRTVKNEEIIIAASQNGARWGSEIAPDFRWISKPPAKSAVSRIISEFSGLNRTLEEIKPDVAFFPFNIMPKVDVPSVLLVHDLVNEFYAKKFPLYKPIYRRAVRSFVRNSIRRADNLITISETVAGELRNSGLVKESQKIFVAPLSSQPVCEMKKPENFTTDGKKIILQTGDHLPHKNHITGLRAIAYLVEKHPLFADDLRLVLTGGAIKDKNLRKFVRNKKLEDRIIFLGRVSEGELEWLLEKADLICFPTLYEGFGLGIIEAQMRKKPILSSGIAVLREVSGGYGIFFEPKNHKDLAEKMLEILSEKGYERDLLEKGLKNAESWSWSDHAERILEVLKFTAKRKNSQSKTLTT